MAIVLAAPASNKIAIRQALMQLAVEEAGVAFPPGSIKFGDWPVPTDLETGLPYFACGMWSFAGYGTEGQDYRPDWFNARGMRHREIAWNWPLRAIFDFSSDRAVYQAAYEGADLVTTNWEQTFQEHMAFYDQAGLPLCENAVGHSLDVGYMPVGQKEYLYAEIQIIAFELKVNF